MNRFGLLRAKEIKLEKNGDLKLSKCQQFCC